MKKKEALQIIVRFLKKSVDERHTYTRGFAKLFLEHGPPSHYEPDSLNRDDTKDAAQSFLYFILNESKFFFKTENDFSQEVDTLYTVYTVATRFDKKCFSGTDQPRLRAVAAELVGLFETLARALLAVPSYLLLDATLTERLHALTAEYVLLFPMKRRREKVLLCKKVMDTLLLLHETEKTLSVLTPKEQRKTLEKIRKNTALLKEAIIKYDKRGDFAEVFEAHRFKQCEVFMTSDDNEGVAYMDTCHTVPNPRLVYLQLMYPKATLYDNDEIIPKSMHELTTPPFVELIKMKPTEAFYQVLSDIWTQQRPIESPLCVLPVYNKQNAFKSNIDLFNFIARATDIPSLQVSEQNSYGEIIDNLEVLIQHINDRRAAHTQVHFAKVRALLPSRMPRLVYLCERYHRPILEDEDIAWLKKTRTRSDLFRGLVDCLFFMEKYPPIFYIERFWLDLLSEKLQRIMECALMLWFIRVAFSKDNVYDFQLLFHAEGRKQVFTKTIIVANREIRRVFFLDELRRIGADLKYTKAYFENSFELSGRCCHVLTPYIQAKVKDMLLHMLLTGSTHPPRADDAMDSFLMPQMKAICLEVRFIAMTHFEIYMPLYAAQR